MAIRRIRRPRLWGALAAGLLVAAAFPAAALASGVPVAPPSGLPVAPPTTPPSTTPAQALGTVGSATPVLSFGASLGSAPIINNPDPVVCAAGCWEYTFNVPAAGGAPILVAVRNTLAGPGGAFNSDEGYDLYVYGPGGQLAAAANGIGANGQSAEVDAPAAGTYTVVVTYIYAYDSGAGFTGEVRMMSGASWTPGAPTCGITVGAVTGCFDLPQLQAVPAYDFTTAGIPPVASTPLGFPLPVNLPLPTSCYADETLGLDNVAVTHLASPVLKCLRFTTNVRNVGAGPMTARIPAAAVGGNGQVQVGYIPGDCYAYQLVYQPDGTAVSNPAGACEFHVEHGHFHYDGLLQYALYQAGTGDTPGAPVGTSQKESFCLSDDDYFGFGTPGPNAPRGSVGQPDCNLPRELNLPSAGQAGTGTFVTEGISPGWGDVYTWDTPDQYIDVTNVASGTYDVVEKTNPDGSMLVAGAPQTCAMTQIQLTSGAVSDTVQQIRTVASIPCP